MLAVHGIPSFACLQRQNIRVSVFEACSALDHMRRNGHLQMLRMTSTEDRACVLLAKMPNPARAGSSIVQMAMDGNSCSIM